jgi:hypothetical protein
VMGTRESVVGGYKGATRGEAANERVEGGGVWRQGAG